LILYTKSGDIYSDIVKMLIVTKDIDTSVIDIYKEENENHLEDLISLTPNSNTPTLVTDEGVVVYNYGILIEALEDMYPFPPLFPVFPIKKANTRIILDYLFKGSIQKLSELETKNLSNAEKENIKNQVFEDILKVYKINLKEKENYTQNLIIQGINILDVMIAFMFYHLLKNKLKVATKDRSVLNYIKELLTNEYFVKSLKL